MIKVLDQVDRGIQKYEAQQHSKSRQEKLNSLNMSILIEKNKKDREYKKNHQKEVVQARQLKIKIGQVFRNIFTQSKQSRLRGDLNQQGHSQTKIRVKTLVGSQFGTQDGRTAKQKSLLGVKVLPTSSFTSLSKHSLSSHHSCEFNKDHVDKTRKQAGGAINLFDKFNQKQLDQVQSNQRYFLQTKDMIDLFRRYIVRKRVNTKDNTWDKFMLKNKHNEPKLSPADIEKMGSHKAKEIIFQTYRTESSSTLTNRQDHLLTSPLEETHPKTPKHKQLIAKSTPAFKKYKEKQVENFDKIKKNLERHRKNTLLDRDYFHGIAHQKRLCRLQQIKKAASQRNSLDKKKAFVYQTRLKGLSEHYGESVERAEQIRAQFIKRVFNTKLKLSRQV